MESDCTKVIAPPPETAIFTRRRAPWSRYTIQLPSGEKLGVSPASVPGTM